MLEFDAQGFVNINGHLADIDGYLLTLRRNGHTGHLQEWEKNMVLSHVNKIADPCFQLRLFLSIKQLGRVKDLLRDFAELTVVQQGIAELRNRIVDELKDRIYFSMTLEEKSLYESPMPFGEDVANAVPQEVVKDIEEAAKSLALDRYTASVFHLMRVMEFCVQRLGAKLSVPLVSEKVWQNILDETNKAIRNMPCKTQEERDFQSQLSQVSAYLYSVKVAWRNPVMHPKLSYDPQEARDVYSHVQTFVKSIVSFVL